MDGSISLKQVQLSAGLEDRLRLGLVGFGGLSIGEYHVELARNIEGLTEELRQSLAKRRLSTLAIVERSRRLFHQFGLDPTKHRPSSEKLLRRVQKGRGFPRVNDFVDSMNLVSLRLQFPMGFYDWDHLVPPVLVRIGRPNEIFVGLDGDKIELEGKIVLVDGESPFGNPSHDSERGKISSSTFRALVVLFAPADVPREELEEGIREAAEAGETYCGGSAITAMLP